MRKKVCSFIMAIIVTLLSVSMMTASGTEQKLSELSDSDCVAFLKSNGVAIPNDYEDELKWVPFIKDTIVAVESNPNVSFCYNYHVTQKFANDIKKVVNQYYGIMSNRTSASLGAKAYILQDSTVYGAWSDSFEEYNCYAYAINITDDWLCPGDKSGYTYTVNLSVYTVAQYTKADLEELGYTNVTIHESMPSQASLGPHDKLICVRIKGGVDFHYMKFDAGYWYHKPSNTHTLRYKYTPSISRNWSNEHSYRGYAYAPTFEYNSAIRYIVYTEPHSWTYKYCGNGQHIRTCSICNQTVEPALSCVYVNHTCRLCGSYNNVLNSVGGNEEATVNCMYERE